MHLILIYANGNFNGLLYQVTCALRFKHGFYWISSTLESSDGKAENYIVISVSLIWDNVCSHCSLHWFLTVQIVSYRTQHSWTVFQSTMTLKKLNLLYGSICNDVVINTYHLGAFEQCFLIFTFYHLWKTMSQKCGINIGLSFMNTFPWLLWNFP